MLNRSELHAAIRRSTDGEGEASISGLLFIRTQRLREFEMLFGYAAGERLRQAMLDRLQRALRSVDMIVAIGECDYAAVLPRLHDRQHAALAASKVARLLKEPFEVLGRPARASIVVGAASWPRDGDDPEMLCRHADEACTTALQLRERYALYEGERHEPIAHDALHEAILRNQLEVFLQPIHDIASDRLTGFESLARWRTDDGMVPPATFIAVAEQTGLIDELTRWSINTTLRHCTDLLRAQPGLKCSINLSPRAILDHGIVEQIASSLKIWDVTPGSLIVEITETAFIDDAEQIAEVLAELHAMGVGIAIDDYGTGYSSLTYLKQFPVTALKIDRSFVSDMADNTRSAQLVAAMIELAHRLGAIAVAEGVEDPEALEMLKELGCDQYQGYLKVMPEAAEAVIARMVVPAAAEDL